MSHLWKKIADDVLRPDPWDGEGRELEKVGMDKAWQVIGECVGWQMEGVCYKGQVLDKERKVKYKERGNKKRKGARWLGQNCG